MLVLLSPAKNLSFDRETAGIRSSTPPFRAEANALADLMRTKTARDLSRLMGISGKLAELNVARYQAFAPAPRKETTKPAILAFNGDVYLGLDAATLKAEDLAYAQQHLRILSGLYGVLKPLDAIQPYRLEMGTRLKNSRGKNLYDWWGKAPADFLRKELKTHKAPVILNLASDEYFSAIDSTALNAPVITPVFKEIKDGKARSLMHYVKKARGMMARWVIENKIQSPEAVKKFRVDGYRFDKKASTTDRWVFSRPQPKSLAQQRQEAKLKKAKA